ncbi:MAG TPA: hypothetical protein VM345_10150 [Acidimicrobiales bacterium]|nr:hypothetical protein [Acidimicrobiales bacterium]
MGLDDRLERYEVTTVPVASRRLHLVWSSPAPDEQSTPDAAADDPDETPVVSLLASYRITRVPGRAAS